MLYKETEKQLDLLIHTHTHTPTHTHTHTHTHTDFPDKTNFKKPDMHWPKRTPGFKMLTVLLEYIVLIDTSFLQVYLNTHIFTYKMPTYIITKSPTYHIHGNFEGLIFCGRQVSKDFHSLLSQIIKLNTLFPFKLLLLFND